MMDPAQKYREDLLCEIATETYMYGPSEHLDLLNEEYERIRKVNNETQHRSH